MINLRSTFIRTVANESEAQAIKVVKGALIAHTLKGENPSAVFQQPSMEAWITELIQLEQAGLLALFAELGWTINQNQAFTINSRPALAGALVELLPLSQLNTLDGQLRQDDSLHGAVVQRFKQTRPSSVRIHSHKLAFELWDTEWHSEVIKSHPDISDFLERYPSKIEEATAEGVDVSGRLEAYIRWSLKRGPVDYTTPIWDKLTTNTPSSNLLRIIISEFKQNPRNCSRVLWNIYIDNITSSQRKTRAGIEHVNHALLLEIAKVQGFTVQEVAAETIKELDERDFSTNPNLWSSEGVKFILGMQFPVSCTNLIRLIQQFDNEAAWLYALKAQYQVPAQQAALRAALLKYGRINSLLQVCTPEELTSDELKQLATAKPTKETLNFLSKVPAFNAGPLLKACCKQRNDAMALAMLPFHKNLAQAEVLNFLLAGLTKTFQASLTRLPEAQQQAVLDAAKFCKLN